MNARATNGGALMDGKFPIYYRKPVALNENRHANFGIQPERDFRFARASNVVPLSASEFIFACRHYPIVFSKGDTPLPLALVGLEAGRNIFVNGDGEWERGLYVPAYARRYPFILMEGSAKGQYFLCIDEESDAIKEGSGERLFDQDGKQSEATRQAAEFCRVYQQDHDLAKTFCAALLAENVFTDSEVIIKINGRETRLTGFQAIDAERFGKLDDAIVVDWHRRGFLGLAAHHAASMHAWSDLALRGIDENSDGPPQL